MKTKSNISMPTRVKNLNDNSRNCFLKFANSLAQGVKNGTKAQDTLTQYENKVLNFLETFNHISIEKITIDDIKKYCYSLKVKYTTINNTVSYIKAFFTIVVNEKIQISFDVEDLDTLKLKKAKIENKERKAKPLKIEEIITIRKMLTRTKDYKRLYCFEMFYNYGIDANEMIQCNEKSYKADKGIFILKDRTIKVNNSIQEMIANNPSLLIPKHKTRYQSTLQEIGTMIGRSLIGKDIIATRNQYFLTCQFCNNQYPNTSEFWVLFQYDDDIFEKKWLICKECLHKIQEEKKDE